MTADDEDWSHNKTAPTAWKIKNDQPSIDAAVSLVVGVCLSVVIIVVFVILILIFFIIIFYTAVSDAL